MNLSFVLAVAVALVGATSVAVADTPAQNKFWVYIGTYTRTTSKGIYRFELDAATGKAGKLELAGDAADPSFLAIAPNGRFLYAIAEVPGTDGKNTGGVIAFAIHAATGLLTKLNSQAVGESGTCHLCLDQTGKTVLVANYYGGSAVALPIGHDGKVGPPASRVAHQGSSVNKSRQEAPHPHSINIDPSNRFAIVADLGIDQVRVHRLDPAAAKLTPNDPPGATVAPGAGPRHFAFHPSGKFGYVANELNNTVTVFDYDAAKGILKNKQDISTLPKGFKGTSTSAEIVVHPSGKFLYCSNRPDHNSIAVFSIDSDSGRLTAVQDQPEGIKTPRNFAVDPTGRWLLVGNEDGDSVIIFKIDAATGKLTPTAEKISVPVPVCVRFLAKK